MCVSFLCFAGWWYGVVGHLQSCDGEEHHCHCHNSGEQLTYRHLNWISFSCIDDHFRRIILGLHMLNKVVMLFISIREDKCIDELSN